MQQEALAKMFPGGYDQFAELFAGSLGGTGGSGGNVPAKSSSDEKEAPEEEKVVEVPSKFTLENSFHSQPSRIRSNIKNQNHQGNPFPSQFRTKRCFPLKSHKNLGQRFC